MKINSTDFRVQEGEMVKFKKWPTLVKPLTSRGSSIKNSSENGWGS